MLGFTAVPGPTELQRLSGLLAYRADWDHWATVPPIYMLLGLVFRFALSVICPTSAQLVVVVKYNSGSVSDTANALSTTHAALTGTLKAQRSPGLLPLPPAFALDHRPTVTC